MALTNDDKLFLLNHMNATALKVSLGDLIFGGSEEIGFPAAKTAAYAVAEADSMLEMSANANFTLPLASSVNRGKRIELYFSHASGGGIALSGSDTLGGQSGTKTFDTLTRVVVTSDGSSNWVL